MPAPVGRSTLLADTTVRGRAFCEQYTELIDEWLRSLFDTPVGSSTGVALVAVGGHGRGELAPQSDLDLLLLVGSGVDAERISGGLWYPIWDAGLKLGHAVRSVRDTLALASEDLETATALLSARHLAGDPSLTDDLRERAATNWRRRGRRWLEELAASGSERHRTHGEIAFDLEPDLKDGRGGLRDLHALSWAVAAGAEIDPDVVRSLGAHYDRLLEVRVELHRVTARPGDRLLLQEQDAVASQLGLPDADVLMAQVAAAGREIAWSSDDCWYDIRRSLDRSFPDRFRRERPLGNGVVLRDHRACLADGSRAVDDPLAVLHVAIEAARHGVRIGERTLSLLRDAPPIPEPWPEPARLLLVELLAQGSGAIDVIEALDHAQLWERILREWKANRSRPQRNVYHRYTVDRHLLECAARAADLAHRTARPDLLVLGALLHDIGKGYPGNHSETGELLATGIARRMGYTPGDAHTIGFLVRHHLLLPDVATRRDLDDPATARFVAEIVGTPERLALLHAVAEADGLATGSAAWGPWKRDLVAQLVERTRAQIGGTSGDPGGTSHAGPEDGSDIERGLLAAGETAILADGDRLTVVCPDRRGVFGRVAGVIALHGLDVVEASIHTDDGMALDRFRIRTEGATPVRWEQVERDVRLALDGRLAIEARLAERERRHQRRHRPGLSQLTPDVRFFQDASEHATVVEATGLDQPGLLYRLARALSDLDLDVSAAKIHTVGVDAVDTFYVTDADGGRLTDTEHQREIRRALLHVLDPPS